MDELLLDVIYNTALIRMRSEIVALPRPHGPHDV
jgi:hypothetical protein